MKRVATVPSAREGNNAIRLTVASVRFQQRLQIINRLGLIANHIVVAVITDAIRIKTDVGKCMGQDTSFASTEIRHLVNKYIRVGAIDVQ